MKTLPLIAALLLVLLLSNCNKDNDLTKESFGLNDTLTLSINKSAVNTDNQLAIRIDSVLNDSRCPMDANCIWEGNAEIRFLFTNANVETKFILNTHGGEDFPSDTIIGGYYIQLIALRPYPISTTKISNHEYVADLLIKKE